jgi:hypothetical protein
MKITRSPLFILPAIFGLFAGPAAFGQGTSTVSEAALAAPTVTATESWNTIKDYTYEKRADFTAGLQRMMDRLDVGINQLNAKRATLPETSIKDWDIAMKELTDSAANLKFQLDELSKAAPETWSEMKDRIGLAWKRAQDAYDKVKMSTTT